MTKVKGTVTNFSHTFTHDVYMLLVGPTGQTVMLAGGTGGVYITNNVTLTFDDTAAGLLPHNDPISSGTYKPTNNHPGQALPSPVPRGPYGSTVSAFNNLNPNGTWSLYVADFALGDTGTIGGWNLSIVDANRLVACSTSCGWSPPHGAPATLRAAVPRELIASPTAQPEQP